MLRAVVREEADLESRTTRGGRSMANPRLPRVRRSNSPTARASTGGTGTSASPRPGTCAPTPASRRPEGAVRRAGRGGGAGRRGGGTDDAGGRGKGRGKAQTHRRCRSCRGRGCRGGCPRPSEIVNRLLLHLALHQHVPVAVLVQDERARLQLVVLREHLRAEVGGEVVEPVLQRPIVGRLYPPAARRPPAPPRPRRLAGDEVRKARSPGRSGCAAAPAP